MQGEEKGQKLPTLNFPPVERVKFILTIPFPVSPSICLTPFYFLGTREAIITGKRGSRQKPHPLDKSGAPVILIFFGQGVNSKQSTYLAIKLR